MAPADTAMRFWLRYVDHAGGLWENAVDSTVVVLPDELQDEYGRSDDIRVTADPDVAREDGATLLLAGHPWLLHAAESVVAEGDCGLVRLPRPSGATSGSEQLLAAAREQLPVDHGRIDAAGGAMPGVRPLIRVGALVNYAVSSDVTFSEQLECWIDVTSGIEVADEVVDRLARLVDVEHPERTAAHPPAADLVRALRHADQLFNSRADERAADLARQVANDRDREIERAAAYYADALQSLRRRLDAAAPARAATLSAKIESTESERDRRLAEIAEKYRATHTILPFRLHVIAVPVLRLPVDVRRGERRYPLALDWLLPARRFAPVRCPACQSAAPLVAAKTGLGCQDCMRRPEPSLASTAAVSPASTQRSPKSPAAPQPPEAPHSETRHSETRHSPEARTPPPAGSRPPVPPQARKRPASAASPSAQPDLRAIDKAGRKLVTSLWELTAAGDRRVQRLYAPDSPAAVMHALFGIEGPLRAIGFDTDSQPQSISASDSAPALGAVDVQLIDGGLHTASRRFGFQVCWRFAGKTPLIEEITSFDGAHWPRQPEPRYRPGAAAGQRLYAVNPKPRAQLDAVAAEVWRSVAVHGLPLTLRALAAWWRLEAADAMLARHSPGALAAAVARSAAYRAGVGGRYDDAAATFGVEVGAVRAAATELQRHLRLSESRPW